MARCRIAHLILCLVSALVVVASCAAPTASPTPPSTPTPIPTPTPTPTPTLKKITLADAPIILDISAELPSDFSDGVSEEAEASNLLGVGSPPYIFTEGTVIDTSTGLSGTHWYEIECVLWVVDETTSGRVSATDAMGELGKGLLSSKSSEGHSVDLGRSVDAILWSDEGVARGLECLILKYGRVFVAVYSGYTLPRSQGERVSLVDVGKGIVRRLKEYSQ